MNIGILTGCESDKHLSEQIFIELNSIKSPVYIQITQSDFINPVYIQLTQNNIIESYHASNYYFKSAKYNFVLAVGDRTEQMGGVLAAFQNNIPIGHLYSGDYNTVATHDDKHRHAITLYSDIQFCSCKESMENTIKLMRSAGLVPNANLVGATHFNGIDIEKLKDVALAVKPYVLILINSETKGNNEKLINETVERFISLNKAYNVIIAKGNNDKEDIEKILFNKIVSLKAGCVFINYGVGNQTNIIEENRKDHKYFLSLIKNCEYFITNSSASIYEAPALIPHYKIIHIGNRNKNRTKIPSTSHDSYASFRVAQLIKTFLETKQ